MVWSTADIGDLTGKRTVITGFTGGLGLATAIELARRGASVTVTARDSVKGDEYLDHLERAVPGADADLQLVDLADLDSVDRATTNIIEQHPTIDILINNAGIMVPPKRQTADGFELQIGTNHLGHFAWTAGLWPRLRVSGARIVTVSSMAHAFAKGIELDSLRRTGSSRRYRRWQSYAESKLANLVFAIELDRRIKAAGLQVVSVAAHPGYANTNLQSTGLNMGRSNIPGVALHQISRAVAQSAEAGAWPTLRAATEPGLTGGEFFGPDGLGGLRGRPTLASPARPALDERLGQQLWEASEEALGEQFRMTAD